jgi:hydrogenase maturation protease
MGKVLFFEGGTDLKTLVVGLGNPILTDDGIGIHVVRTVESSIAGSRSPVDNSEVDFVEGSVGGLRLLDVLSGYDRVIMVDAIQTDGGRPGDVYRLHAGDLNASRHAGSTHDLTLPGALALGRRLGMDLPEDRHLIVLAIEAEDVLTFGESCTPSVAAAIPGVVQMVLDEIASTRSEATGKVAGKETIILQRGGSNG